MDNTVDIFSLANYGIRIAEKNAPNFKCAEIFFGKNEYTNIELEENSIKSSEIGRDHGVSIRIYDKRGSLGFAFTNKLNKRIIEKIIKNAIKMMNVGTADPNFQNLPLKYKIYPNRTFQLSVLF